MADRKRLLGQLCVAFFALTTIVRAQPPAAPPAVDIANYDIDVTLDPSTRTLTGNEIITWRNPGEIPAYSIRLHLYWNAFRNTNSTWLKQRQLAGDTALASAPEGDFGYTLITSLKQIRADGSEIDLPNVRYISPDDQNRDDRTLLSADLPEGVAPGQSMRLRVAWTGRFPRNFDRTGAIGNYFFASQWFPKLGAFDAGGWVARQFFANAEFFSDFGRYDVRMRVPGGWTVGATGVEQSRTPGPPSPSASARQANQVTYRYVQDRVHDFAWTASPDFLERTQRFEHAGLPPVNMRLLLQPEHEHLAERHFAAAAATLRYFGEWFGPYPYSSLTIVDPAFQSESEGMEYPTIFTGGTRWLAPRNSNDPEYVVIHETGHQWWQGMVANNEVLHAWIDEGITEYADSRLQSIVLQPNYLVQRFFGGFIPWQYRDIPLKRATDTNYMNTFRRAPDRDPISTPTYLLWPGTHQNQSYHKTALLLHTLERLHSWEVMQRVLSTFFTRWQYRHPSPEDFFAVLKEVTGDDHTWFLDQAYRNSYTYDYAIERLDSASISWRGLNETAKGMTFEQHTLDKIFRTTVVARRIGAGQFPVDVLVTFSDGHQERERWDGRARWQYFTFDRPARAVSAQIDPERVLLLDTSFTNNSRTLEPARDRAATKWSLRWMVWLQDLFMTYAFLV
ncbi:MAG TPA: M1 family metallopeptidase [Vicinamibacterales bacterium]|nr:M1 family metallopeptidase [Vicinamibacterales bacterium]